MKTMKDYTNFCTAEQTRRAYELGAQIEKNYCETPNQTTSFKVDGVYIVIPTTQQMIGWLREKGLVITAWLETPMHNYHSRLSIWKLNDDKIVRLFDGGEFANFYTYEQAELTAIDAALDYLEKGGTK